MCIYIYIHIHVNEHNNYNYNNHNNINDNTNQVPIRPFEFTRQAQKAPHPTASPWHTSRRHQTCHFRKRATSAPAEGPSYRLDFARHYLVRFPSGLCSRRSCMCTEVARLVPPDTSESTISSKHTTNYQERWC